MNLDIGEQKKEDILVRIISDLLGCGHGDVSSLVDIYNRFGSFNVSDYKEPGSEIITFKDFIQTFISYGKELLIEEIREMDGLDYAEKEHLEKIINEIAISDNFLDWGGLVEYDDQFEKVAYAVREFLTGSEENQSERYAKEIADSYKENSNEKAKYLLQEIIYDKVDIENEKIIEDLEEKPIIDVVENNELTIYKSLYHTLFEGLVSSTKQSQNFQTLLDKMIEENKDKSIPIIMEEFAEYYDETEDEVKLFNTYNRDNFVYKDIEYVTFRDKETEETYIILRVHNGTDIRSGYSDPKVFTLHPFGTEELNEDLYTISRSLNPPMGSDFPIRLMEYNNGKITYVDESIKTWNMKVEDNTIMVRKDEHSDWMKLKI